MCLTAITDQNVRLAQYLEAINWYLDNTSFPLLIVENTNFEMRPYLHKKSDRIEFFTFQGAQDYEKGKGYGEGEILRYGFEHSQLIHNNRDGLVLKVSGRYIIKNLRIEMRLLSQLLPNTSFFSSDFIATIVQKHTKTAVSYCFLASRIFYEKQLLEQLKRCNDSKNICFEHILYDAICHSKNSFTYPLDLHVDAMSGTTGNKFWTPTWRSHFHQIRAFCHQLLKCWISKILCASNNKE